MFVASLNFPTKAVDAIDAADGLTANAVQALAGPAADVQLRVLESGADWRC